MPDQRVRAVLLGSRIPRCGGALTAGQNLAYHHLWEGEKLRSVVQKASRRPPSLVAFSPHEGGLASRQLINQSLPEP